MLLRCAVEATAKDDLKPGELPEAMTIVAGYACCRAHAPEIANAADPHVKFDHLVAQMRERRLRAARARAAIAGTG